MPGNFSTLLLSRRVTVSLVALVFVLLLVIVIIGLNNITGLILAYITVTTLFLILTRKWRRIRNFLILFCVSLLSIFLLSFLFVEVIYRFTIVFGGFNAVKSTAFNTVNLIISNIILLACPPGLFVGIVGALALGIMRISSNKQKKPTDVAEDSTPEIEGVSSENEGKSNAGT
jgi:hypothetical protein